MAKKETNVYLIELGKNVNKLRTKRKLSLRELAASCNVDHSDIGKIEKGQINITILTLIDLAKGLDTLPKKLLDFEIDLQ